MQDLEDRWRVQKGELQEALNTKDRLIRDLEDQKRSKEVEIALRMRFEERLNNLHSLNRLYCERSNFNHAEWKATEK